MPSEHAKTRRRSCASVDIGAFMVVFSGGRRDG
jgi:hypothetical protein